MINSVRKPVEKLQFGRQINGKFQTVLLKKSLSCGAGTVHSTVLNKAELNWLLPVHLFFQNVFPGFGNRELLRKDFVCGNQASERW
jgi:hypothetical protein